MVKVVSDWEEEFDIVVIVALSSSSLRAQTADSGRLSAWRNDGARLCQLAAGDRCRHRTCYKFLWKAE